MTALTGAIGASGSSQRVPPEQVATYRKPVLDRDFPDPDVTRAPNGWYYAYGTESQQAGRLVNIQVARSRDLVRWHYLGDALPKLPSWGNKEQVS
jgi:arabinan endo-1,5-alpha-L-arabinosidase